MCFEFIWEQTVTYATYSINWWVFITRMKSVYCAVWTGSLNKAVCALSLNGYWKEGSSSICSSIAALGVSSVPNFEHSYWNVQNAWNCLWKSRSYMSSKGTKDSRGTWGSQMWSKEKVPVNCSKAGNSCISLCTGSQRPLYEPKPDENQIYINWLIRFFINIFLYKQIYLDI